jgi:peptide deformylase
MTIFRIFYYPHVLLRKASTPVEKFTDELRSFLKDFATTMKTFQGSGLAGTHVGVAKKLFIADLGDALDQAQQSGQEFVFEVKNAAGEIIEPMFPMAFINAEIIEKNHPGTIEWEGSLSFVGVDPRPTQRFQHVTVKAQDEWGKPFTVRSTHLYASTCFQHEIDHCNGVLLIDAWPKGTYKEKDVAADIQEFLKTPAERKRLKHLELVDASKIPYDFL